MLFFFHHYKKLYKKIKGMKISYKSEIIVKFDLFSILRVLTFQFLSYAYNKPLDDSSDVRFFRFDVDLNTESDQKIERRFF